MERKTMEITLMQGIAREFKTKKAAEKFTKRLIKGGYVKEERCSYFGFPLNKKGTIFRVYEGEGEK